MAEQVDERPSSGSCPICRASLDLASVRRGKLWYCSTACAEGRPMAAPRRSEVPEHWLYPRPRRFYRKRQPKELQRKPSDT